MEDSTVSTVNFDTLLRGYQAFSSENELDRLAQKIVIFIIENVGVERVCLLFEHDDEWIIAAESESALGSGTIANDHGRQNKSSCTGSVDQSRKEQPQRNGTR